ncbi:terminase [Salmonella enterica subsp. enterica serovar Tennessee]|nr:terminase [Salmonella enterica subsp. enterica serovar Tennessee]
MSFMSIRKTMTSSGRSATYEASRTEEASHADIAWATMHALLNDRFLPVAACSLNPFWRLTNEK